MNIKIADVQVPRQRRRGLEPASVRTLMDSIREVGLLHPITITKDRMLVSGLHRKEACERLGWTEIPAVVVDLDDLRTELAEIDENLIRNDLSALERSESLARRKEIYESLHPGATHGGDRGNQHVGGKIHNPDLASFVDDTAAKTGRSRTVIADEVKIGRDLAPDVKDALRGTELADSKTALLALATEPEARQRELVAAGPDAIRAAAKAKRAKVSMRLSPEEKKQVDALMSSEAPQFKPEPKPDFSKLPDPGERLASLLERIDHAMQYTSGVAALALVSAARDAAVAMGSDLEAAQARYQRKVHGLVNLSSTRRSNRRHGATPKE